MLLFSTFSVSHVFMSNSITQNLLLHLFLPSKMFFPSFLSHVDPNLLLTLHPLLFHPHPFIFSIFIFANQLSSFNFYLYLNLHTSFPPLYPLSLRLIVSLSTSGFKMRKTD